MRLFRNPSARQIDLGLLIIRIVVGVVFIAHGVQKLFIFGFPGVTVGFAKMGIPAPDVTGPFIALLEFSAGFAILFGLLTRLAALGLLCDMLGAMWFVHLKNGFFLPTGFEYPLSLAAASAMLLVTGAGAISIDGLIGGSRVSGTGVRATETRAEYDRQRAA